MKNIICALLICVILCGLVACNGNVNSNSENATNKKDQTEVAETKKIETEKLKTGTVTGEVTYKYNDYVGSKPDTGADVLLISKKVTSLPDDLAYGNTRDLPDGCYATKVSGSGKYTFNNIPVGEYVLIFISENTTPNPKTVAGFYNWGNTVYEMFSETGQKRASNFVLLHKIHNEDITVTEGEVTCYHDFGITYN